MTLGEDCKTVIASSARPSTAGDRRRRLAEMYRAHGPSIVARCRRILRDGHAAEDAAQETFVRVLRHVDAMPDSAEALRWLYRVATNCCLNRLRDERRREALAFERSWASNQQTLERDLELRNSIVNMPRGLQVVGWLYHVEGLNQQEVADRLGVSRRTVVNRLAELQVRARITMGQRYCPSIRVTGPHPVRA